MELNDNYEKNLMISFIKIIAYLFRWLFLIFAVVMTSLTIAFLVLVIFRSESLDSIGLSKMVTLMTYYQESDMGSIISTLGKTNVIVGTLYYGFASSITYIILYLITSKFIKLFKLISKNKTFSDASLKLVNDSIPLGVLVTLTQPVCLFVANITTGMFKYEDFNISGIIILFAIYILKLIIENGNSLLKEKEKLARDLSASSCLVSNMKIEEIKKREAKKEKQNRQKKKKAIKR